MLKILLPGLGRWLKGLEYMIYIQEAQFLAITLHDP